MNAYLCVKRERADEAFGPSAAQSLFRMLADAEAAESAAELLALYEGVIEIVEGDFLLLTLRQNAKRRLIQ